MAAIFNSYFTTNEGLEYLDKQKMDYLEQLHSEFAAESEDFEPSINAVQNEINSRIAEATQFNAAYATKEGIEDLEKTSVKELKDMQVLFKNAYGSYAQTSIDAIEETVLQKMAAARRALPKSGTFLGRSMSEMRGSLRKTSV